MAMMRESIKLLGHILQRNVDILPTLILLDKLSRAKIKAGCPQMGWENVVRKGLREKGAFWNGENG